MDNVYSWPFPLPRTHTGMLLGNATLGAMIWGGGNVLNITLGRADAWDHRGGLPWTDRMTYANIRRLLEANDEAGLKAIFHPPPAQAGVPRRPSIIPIGRLELVFDDGITLDHGDLDLSIGRITVHLRSEISNLKSPITLDLSMHEPVLRIACDGITPREIRRVTSWNYVGDYLRSISFAEPQMIDSPQIAGWVQHLPADPAVCVAYRRRDSDIWVTVTRGEGSGASQLLDKSIKAGADALLKSNRAWWGAFWQRTPRIDLPNERLSFLYNYGMYKFAGLTSPDGVPAGLQGPWIEEYQMPPWSADYHFNINVQMCYWPAYGGNHLSHLPNLFEMIWGWRDLLARHAKLCVGIDDGLMLPHAVDDRCNIMGGFWSGTIDHGCTAWVAKMMYDYWLHGGDEQFLRTRAWPFMVGAMRVYEQMLERDGDHYVLPVSVSPEYRGSAMNAWGRNASFQLACIHWLIEALQNAAKVLGEIPRPIWREIQQRLPRACILTDKDWQPFVWTELNADQRPPEKARFGLWDGTPLEESHRHHSYMAGIHPFDVIDVDDPAWRPVVENTYANWIHRGMGLWSGWCMPWAAMLHNRVGNADAAQLIMEIWQRVFTNEGHGTLHDCRFPGFSLIGCGPTRGKQWRPEIMQMDAGMGAVAAILDMLAHTRRGVLHLFAGAPDPWRNVAFEGIRTEGAFLVSARRTDGKVTDLRITSQRGGPLRLKSPWKDEVLVLETKPGQTLTIRP